MSDITLIDDSEQSSLVTNGLAKNGEMYLKKAGSTDAGSIVVYDSGAWKTFANEYTSGFINDYSVDFDGTNDYAAITTATDNIYSLSMWFKPDADINSASYNQILFGSVAGSHYVGLGSISSSFTNEVITVYRGAGGFAYTDNTATISSSQWNHLFISWLSSSTINSGSAGFDIWLNGTQVGNAVGGSVPTAPLYFRNDTKIGTRASAAYYFNGKIDEVATWTSDVSADVATIYNSGVPGDLSSLSPAHWWRMGDDDSGTGTTITDQGSLGDDATLTNGPTFSSDVPS